MILRDDVPIQSSPYWVFQQTQPRHTGLEGVRAHVSMLEPKSASLRKTSHRHDPSPGLDALSSAPSSVDSSASRSRACTWRGSAKSPRKTTRRIPTAYQRVMLKVRAKLCALACSPARTNTPCTCFAAGDSGCAVVTWQVAGTLVGSVDADRSCTQSWKPATTASWS